MNVHVSVLREEEIKVGLESEIITVGTDGDYIPVPSTAEVGQTIVVKAVDENGKPTEWEAVDAADAAEIGARLSSLADDLSDLAPAGAAVGQLFRVAAISEDGKYTMEPVDMLDVKINGESIVKDGVANIPIITGYNNFGLMRIETDYNGISVNSNGQISIADASESHINGRNSKRAIVPTNMDYAFKAAMCDGIGASWTAEEQAAARERMGVNKPYELIEKITLDEEVSTVERSFEPDGNEYNFRDLAVIVSSQIAASAATYDCYITDSNNIDLVGVASGMLQTKLARCAIFYFERYGGYINVKSCVANQRHMLVLGNLVLSPSTFGIASGEIKKMKLTIRSGYTAQLPIGTEINIYGVRA